MSHLNTSISSPRLDSDLLRTFLAVAAAGTVGGGAARVHRTQSAVTLQIQKLELILGRSVFRRHARGVVLTGAGERLLPVARQVVAALDQAVSEARADALSGAIQVGLPEEYGTTLLPSILARFAADHPEVEVTVRCAVSTAFPTALERGELDIAVFSTDKVEAHHSLLRSEAVCWAGSRVRDLHGIDPLPLALFDRACWWRDRALEMLDAASRRYRVVYTSESVAGVRAAIVSGIAVGVLPEDALGPDLRVLPSDAGLPSLAGSPLVLAEGPGAPSPLRDAMAKAIRAAFA